MWPAQQWTPCGGVSSTHPQHEESQVVQARDQAFWVQSSTYNPSGPVTPVPGESVLSPSVSIDYSALLAKPESIIETLRDSNWTLDLGRLINEEFVPNLSNNCCQSVQNFNSPTKLQSSVSKPHLQNQKS